MNIHDNAAVLARSLKSFASLVLVVLLSVGPVAAQQKKSAAKKETPTAATQRKEDAKTVPPAVRADYGKYDFTLTTLEGKEIRLSDFSGKVVLVNLWAPWCGPCKIEMPGFAKLHDKYKDQGFEIISVAVQTNESAVRDYLQKFDMKWPVGLNDDVAKKYATYGLPDNYLFLPDGMMTRHFIGYTKEEVLEPLIQAGIKRIKEVK